MQMFNSYIAQQYNGEKNSKNKSKKRSNSAITHKWFYSNLLKKLLKSKR